MYRWDWGTAVWTVVAICASWMVARYYYSKRPNVVLVSVLTGESVLLRGVDSDVLDLLSIRYKNELVSNLTQVEIAVANRGSQAIDRPIRPISLDVGSSAESHDLLDVSVVAMSVDRIGARVVGIEDDRALVDFDLLNPNDFFKIKVLLAGEYSSDNLQLGITAANIPPVLQLMKPSEIRPQRRLAWWPVWIAPVPLVLAASWLMAALEQTTFVQRMSQPAILLLPALIVVSLAMNLVFFLLLRLMEARRAENDRFWAAVSGEQPPNKRIERTPRAPS